MDNREQLRLVIADGRRIPPFKFKWPHPDPNTVPEAVLRTWNEHSADIAASVDRLLHIDGVANIDDNFVPARIEQRVQFYLSEVEAHEEAPQFRKRIDSLTDAIERFMPAIELSDGSAPLSSHGALFRYARSIYCFDVIDAEATAFHENAQREAEWSNRLSPERMHDALATWIMLLTRIRNALPERRPPEEPENRLVADLAKIWTGRGLTFDDVHLGGKRKASPPRGAFVELLRLIDQAIERTGFDANLKARSGRLRERLASYHRIEVVTGTG